MSHDPLIQIFPSVVFMLHSSSAIMRMLMYSYMWKLALGEIYKKFIFKEKLLIAAHTNTDIIYDVISGFFCNTPLKQKFKLSTAESVFFSLG